MRIRSNKKKKEVRNANIFKMPRTSNKNNHKIIETVNLVDSDEEITQENVVSSALQVSTVNSNKSHQDVKIKNNKSAEWPILNSQVLLNLERSCFISTDTTFTENTFGLQNEKPEECGSGTPTTKRQLGESSQSKDAKQVIECRPSEDIIAHKVNRSIHNEEQSKADHFASSWSSSNFTENNCTNDDSDVVFVSQVQNCGKNLENSVLVIKDDDSDAFKNCSKKMRRRLRRKQRQLLNVTKEVEQNRHQSRKFNTCDNTSGTNALNRVGLREIVIDGSNIAFSHSNGEYFSVRGLYIAIEYFLKKGHKVTAFVPQFRLKVGESSCPAFLQELANNRYVILTPSREVKGKRITPYDDRFIVQYAHIKEAIIVSNDNYRDLLLEKPEWQSTIANRILMYTWVEDLLIFPEDPLGRKGLPLSEFLKFA